MVVRLIEGHQRSRYPALVDAMFRGRAEMFAYRLGWDVVVRDGWEIDLYDDLNPLYLVSLSDDGRVRGSLRLMPTTGRTLMTQVFARAFADPVDIRSALVLEGTRFCVHPDPGGPLTAAGLSRTTCELFMAMCEVSLAMGLSHIVAIYDTTLPRIYKRIGWSPDPLGSSDAFPHGRIYAGLWDVSDQALADMRERSGIAGNVIENASVLAKKAG